MSDTTLSDWFERHQREGTCWECGTPLETDEDRERGAHEECVRAHMDYIERWGSGDD